MSTAERYRRFAAVEAAGSSPSYERLCEAIAADDVLIDRISALPPPKQQPNLLLAACKFIGAPLGTPPAALEFIHDHWTDIHNLVMTRWTQTNEAARAGAFLPLLAQLAGPIALIEVGASAGLCLYPDRYRIEYDNTSVGPHDSPVKMSVSTTGPVPVPLKVPEIRSRVGIDRNPLDVRDDDDLRWLEACIWPEHTERVARLHAAATVVAADPPELVHGDLLEVIGERISSVESDVTPVVFHSAVLNYLTPDERRNFADRLAMHPRVVWFSNEAPGVVETVRTALRPPSVARTKGYFVLGVDGQRVAGISDPHGTWLRWGLPD